MSELKPRVLLVDDEQRILSFVGLKLKTSGYEVITASTGQEALTLAESRQPDIMVLDIVMPEMNGFEVLERLRAYSDLPVIVFSGETSSGDKALSLGADDFVAKPFDPDELEGRIRAILDRRDRRTSANV